MRNSQPNVIGVDLSVAARVAQLQAQRALVGRYWHDAMVQVDDFKNEGVVASSSWPFQVNLLETDKKPVASTIPEEGATGWADTTMMHVDAKHPNCAYKVAMVSLTGSIDTSRKVLQAASATLKRTHLELGGKAPVIVFDDADLPSVVAGIKTFGYYNASQDCTAACRIYAGKKINDNLVADLSSATTTRMKSGR